MGLVELKCKQCGTVFFGVKGRDTHCHICKAIIMFREFFGLQDIEVDEIDFKRVRDPKWEECHPNSKGWKIDGVEDWRNFIPEGVKKIWWELPFEARVMAVMFAEKVARKEEPQC